MSNDDYRLSKQYQDLLDEQHEDDQKAAVLYFAIVMFVFGAFTGFAFGWISH